MPSGTFYQRTALAAAIAACFPAMALGAGVARVDFATGSVTAVAPDGRSRPLSKGSEIDVGETVATQQGRAQLRFVDGAFMSLQPQTEFKVEEFKYSGKGTADQGDSIVMNLLKGGLRTITGLIGRANRNNYRLRTDVATIGIRGTEYSVKYTNSIEVFCADGSIVVQNEGGTLQLNGGQGGYVASNQTPPQQTENRPVLPPESPTDEQLNEPRKKPEDPDNEIQDSDEGVGSEIAAPTPPPLLTGKFLGNIAVSQPSLFYAFVNQLEVELDGAGGLIAFDGSEGLNQVGSASSQSAGNDGIIAWGRWIDGVPEGDLSSIDLTTEGAFHYVVGLPATNMPATGQATYSMIGSTTPSISAFSGFSATVASSSLNVDFQWSAVTVQLGLNVSGSGVNGVVNGSGVTSLDGAAHFSTSLSASGPFSFQNLFVNGFLAGDAAARAGMSYHLSTSLGEAAGAIAYQRGALSDSSPTNPLPNRLVLIDGQLR
jgi:hypothetical protein